MWHHNEFFEGFNNLVEYGAFNLVGFLEAIYGYIVKSESLCYDCGGANVVAYHYWVDRTDVGFIRFDGPVGSGSDDLKKMAVGTSTKLDGYGLSICFILSMEVLKDFVDWVSADGGQGWLLEIYIFDIDWFGCSCTMLSCQSSVSVLVMMCSTDEYL